MAPEFFAEPASDGIEIDQDSVFCVATDLYAFAMVCYQVIYNGSLAI